MNPKNLIQLYNHEFSQQLNDYIKLQLINQSNYGKTFLIKNKNKNRQLYLLSQYPIYILNNKSIKDHLFTSLMKLIKLQSYDNSDQYIINYRTHFLDKNFLYFIFDYKNTINFGNFYNNLLNTTLSFDFTLNLQSQSKFCYQLITGLNWIHSKNVTHGNVQIESIWMSMDNYQLYWVNFGFIIPTSPLYASPELSEALIEQDQNKPEKFTDYINNQKKLMSNDVWGLGVIIHYIITGQYLHINNVELSNTMSQQQIWTLLSQLKSHRNNLIKLDIPNIKNIKLPINENIDNWLAFILWILNPNWMKRPTINQLLIFFEQNLLNLA